MSGSKPTIQEETMSDKQYKVSIEFCMK